jgi:hypothetical protein
MSQERRPGGHVRVESSVMGPASETHHTSGNATSALTGSAAPQRADALAALQRPASGKRRYAHFFHRSSVPMDDTKRKSWSGMGKHWRDDHE